VIRDRGPIHNLGYGITSRDLPFNEGETEGVSPNSGYVSKALDGHPVMRFFAHTAASMAVAGVLGAGLKKGGLRLAEKLQSKLSTTTIKDITQIRKHLDELQGVKRAIEGVDDPYEALVFRDPNTNELTTGYLGKDSEVHRGLYLTSDELKQAGRGITSEPAAVWSLKDDIQKKLVRAGRRMPYELPALYVTQRGISDQLFGDGENRKKLNWYNPADVVSDFVKTSVTNVATMILPFETAGAGITSGKRSLSTFKNSMQHLHELSPIKQKAHKGFVDLTELLSEVGHDLSTISNKFLRTASQTSAAVNAAANALNEQPRFVDALSKARFGYKEARRRSIQNGESRLRKAGQMAKGLAFGVDDEYGALDAIPAFRGLTQAVRKGHQEFKLFGQGYDALQSSMKYNQMLSAASSKDELHRAMNVIQSQYSSRFSRLASQVAILGGGGPGDKSFNRSDFFMGQQQHEYKKLLAKNLEKKGLTTDEAESFASQLRVAGLTKGTDPTNIVSIGRNKITAEGDEYYRQIIDRFRGVKGGKELAEKFNSLAGTSSSSEQFLRGIIQDSNDQFFSKEFQTLIRNKIGNQWNSFYRGDLVDIGSSFLKPQKALFHDFVGPLGPAKQEFLQRKTAQALGLKLKDKTGNIISNDIVKGHLSKRGYDPNNFVQLRSLLIERNKMTSGVFNSGFNLFGLKPMLLDEAISSGRFQSKNKTEQGIIGDLAKRMALNDPVSKSIGLTRLDGVYKTRSGNVLDFSSIKKTFAGVADFFASEFHIPIVKLNVADLFGYRSFSEMARRGPLQYSPGMTVQPFGDLARTKSDFHIWHSTGGFLGTKGKVTTYSTDSFSGAVYGDELKGTYRPIPTNSTEMFSRHARLSSGMAGEAPYDISGNSGSRFLNLVLGNSQRARGFKNFMAIDAEQPNSLFGLGKRFLSRNRDINNPRVLGKLISGQEVRYKSGTTYKTMKLDTSGNSLRVIDDAGNAVAGIEEADILRAYNSVRKQSFQSGFSSKFMGQLEEASEDLFTFGPLKSQVSKIGSPQDLSSLLDDVEGALPGMAAELRAKNIDPSVVQKMYSRIRSLRSDADLLSRSQLSGRTPSINTRLEELKSETFRFIAQSNALIGSNGQTKEEMFITMQSILQNMKKTLPASQQAEAQAAVLSTLFNINAFGTFKQGIPNMQNAREAAISFFKMSQGQAGESVRQAVSPFTEGTFGLIGTNVRKPFSSFIPGMKRIFGTAQYELDDLSTDVLGSGQRTTFVPTFGTVFGKNPMAAIKSALGINTYSNPEGFSGMSVPISQGVERLNKYFGTLGLQLDVSKFKGPLDLYTRGMVGKRVLPIYAAGATAMTVDRTIGGMVGERDQYGEKVYSPYFTTKAARGVVELQSLVAGLAPGGMTAQEKKEQLLEGEVPIRQGRFWPLGNTPFQGGKIMYYRPSWYRKLQGGALFTDDTYGSPAEKFLFYNDISPLRPLDPYRFERKHYSDRPYPVSGEYFSGPWGPLTSMLNATVGRVLKPQVEMHEEEVRQALGGYVPAGQFGAYNTSGYSFGGYKAGVSQFGGGGTGPGFTVPNSSAMQITGQMMGANNGRYAAAAGSPLSTASNITTSTIAGLNAPLMQMSYGPPKQRGVMAPPIVPAGVPISSGSMGYQMGEIGYRSQEMLGIYGFGFSSLREKFGFGKGDFEPDKAVLQSASKAYGTGRAFWDLNLGGLGDVPLTAQGALGNLEFSEIVRRFIPKERTGIDYLNPIKNTMGQQYPFLPGSEYYVDFTRGDPFTKISEGELRLPGIGYERFNTLYSDQTGKYGVLNQLDILADVAPYSQQFKSVNKLAEKTITDPGQRMRLMEIQSQVAETTQKYSFSQYQYKDKNASEAGMHPTLLRAAKFGEYLAHRDTLFNTKFMQKRTAVEDWERRNVYGSTFPEWQRPFESFIQPMINRATQRDPISAAAALGFSGSLFGRTPRAKLFGSLVGATTGFTASSLGQTVQKLSGERYIPRERRKELALEEYSDILTYVKNTRLATMAAQAGDRASAFQFGQAAKRTMYGADIYGASVDTLSLAVPKRKREHFREMLNAPVEDRKRILSTAGRLERRIYQAAWGMQVEKRPDLAEYFERHQLPDASWEGWHPNTNMEHVKIKIGQSMGLEMSQMGYYPQQIKEATLTNPSYPDFYKKENDEDVLVRLRRLMSGSGISGTITPVMNPFGSNDIDISAGIR
jgi:hypothetical protein